MDHEARPPLPPKHEVQLWVPAGTEEALVAAVAGGADAVVIGGHGTRPAPIASATATREGRLKRAIDHAHVLGVQVLVALDPVVQHHPASRVDAFLETAYELGADGVLVQDTGLLEEVELPEDLPVQPMAELGSPELVRVPEQGGLDGVRAWIEAGTQVVLLDLHLPEPVLSAAATHALRRAIDQVLEPGAERVETAYELGGRILAAHGAGVSHGGRLGEVVDSAAGWVKVRLEGTLRVKDQVVVEHDPANWEGTRSGKPERAPDGPARFRLVADQILLDDAYTSQARTGEVVELRGKQWSAPGDAVYKAVDSRVLDRADELVEGLPRRTVPITLHGAIEIGHRLAVTAVDVYRQIEAIHTSAYVVEEAKSAPMTHENAVEQLDRLGDTPFQAAEISLELQPGAFVPLSELNEARRRACGKLELALADAYRRDGPAGA